MAASVSTTASTRLRPVIALVSVPCMDGSFQPADGQLRWPVPVFVSAAGVCPLLIHVLCQTGTVCLSGSSSGPYPGLSGRGRLGGRTERVPEWNWRVEVVFVSP